LWGVWGSRNNAVGWRSERGKLAVGWKWPAANCKLLVWGIGGDKGWGGMGRLLAYL